MELLSPAGNFEALKSAIKAGADSVYFGLKGFNARKKAENAEDDLEEWIDFCHLHGVKAHVAANILLKDGELSDCLSAVASAYNLGADAVIVQDLGLMGLLKELYPQIPVHISTQAGIFSVLGLEFLKEIGNAERVVVSRESELSEIVALSKRAQTEVFCHGALCVAFSGNCYYSSLLCGESGNRGRCRQLCRTEFSARAGGKQTEKSFLLSTKDMCLIEKLQTLKQAGVASVKIEGRLRRSDYVSAVTHCYRRALDGNREQNDLSVLKRAFNRGNFTPGYAFSEDVTYRYVQSSIGQPVGKLTAVNRGGAEFQSAVKLVKGDGFKILRGQKETGGGTLQASLGGGRYLLNATGNLKAGDVVCLTGEAAPKSYEDRANPLIKMHITLMAGKETVLVGSCNGEIVSVTGGAAEAASTRPISGEQVKKQLEKTGGTPFRCEAEADICGDVFIGVGELNLLRRTLIDRLTERLLAKYKRNLAVRPLPKVAGRELVGRRDAFIVPTLTHVDKLPGDVIYNPAEFDGTCFEKRKDILKEVYLYLPYFIRQEDIELIKPHLKAFKGIYCNNPYAVTLAKQQGVEAFIGDMNVFSSYSAGYLRGAAEKIAVSKELNLSEIEKLSDKALYVFAYGAVALMQLRHCPAKNAFSKECGECAYRSDFALTDRSGAAFPVRRTRYKNCYFTLYNSLPLAAAHELKERNRIFDLSLMTDGEIARALAADFKAEGNFTRGHIFRGVK